MPDGVLQILLLLVALLAAAMLVGAVSLRLLRRLLVSRLLAGMPREQTRIFEFRLREQFFRNPFAVMTLLFADGRAGHLRKLWDESKPPPRKAGFQPGLPSEGLAVYRTRLHDGRAIAVVILPPPERDGEAYFVALVLPQDERLRDDVRGRGRQARFFMLYRGSGVMGHRTDLRGWTHNGKERFYNVEAPIDPERFAAAVGDKLRELRL